MSRLTSGPVLWIVQLSALVLLLDEVICKDPKEVPRNSRFLSFETTEDNIRVDLDFSIPFLSIPVKKTLESTFGSTDVLSQFPTVNVNLAGVVLGGAVVLGSTFILPFILRTIAVDHPDEHHHYARLLENTEFKGDYILNSINDLMTADSNLLSCIQRFVCWTAKNASNMMARTRGSKTTYMLNEIVSNSLLNSLLNGTAVDAAIKSGHERHNCTAIYTDCPVSDVNMKIFMANLSKLGKL